MMISKRKFLWPFPAKNNVFNRKVCKVVVMHVEKTQSSQSFLLIKFCELCICKKLANKNVAPFAVKFSNPATHDIYPQ